MFCSIVGNRMRKYKQASLLAFIFALITLCIFNITHTEDAKGNPRKLNTIKEPIDIKNFRQRVEESLVPSHSQKFILAPVFDFNTACDISCNIRKSWQWTMVTFIKSAADNFKRRSFIRRTWGSIRYTSSGRFLFVFVIGRPSSEQAFSLVKEEWERNQDILLYDGPDDYRNIVSKTLAGMQWASENLSKDYFYSSADDDVILDVALFQEIVNENFKETEKRRWPNFPVICTYGLAKQYAIGYRKEKFHRSNYKWPHLPRACLGGFYTTSVKLISELWIYSHNEDDILQMDDVWITGILRQKLGIPDYAVVEPTNKAAEHFAGFQSRSDPQSIMAKEWAAFYLLISQQLHCLCCLHGNSVCN